MLGGILLVLAFALLLIFRECFVIPKGHLGILSKRGWIFSSHRAYPSGYLTSGKRDSMEIIPEQFSAEFEYHGRCSRSQGLNLFKFLRKKKGTEEARNILVKGTISVSLDQHSLQEMLDRSGKDKLNLNLERAITRGIKSATELEGAKLNEESFVSTVREELRLTTGITEIEVAVTDVSFDDDKDLKKATVTLPVVPKETAGKTWLFIWHLFPEALLFTVVSLAIIAGLAKIFPDLLPLIGTLAFWF